MKDKEISIIIPIYNAEKTMKNTVQSILKQSNFDMNSIEIILVNDGSTDNSEKVYQETYAEYDNIKYIHIENQGPSNARNVGLDNATGKYVMFIDSDDTYEDNVFNEIKNKLKDETLDLLCFNYYEVSSDTRRRTEEIKNSLYKENSFEFIEDMIRYKKFNPIWNKVYKRSIIEKFNIRFDKDIKMGEDFRFNIDYCIRASRLEVSNFYLYNYYINLEGLCSTYKNENYEEKKSNLLYFEKILNENKRKSEIIYKKYMDLYIKAASSILESDKKDKKDRIKNIINDNKVDDIIKNKNKLSFEHKICIFLMSKKLTNLFIFYIKLREYLKVIVQKIK